MPINAQALSMLTRLQGTPMAMRKHMIQPLAARIYSGEFSEVEEEKPHEISYFVGTESRVPGNLKKTDRAIAVVPIRGSIGQRRGGDRWAGTYSEDVGNQLLSLAANPNIGAIVLDVDSPGGVVTGIPELGATIRQVDSVKPVYSLANGMSASAGFWLSSQARQSFATPSSEVGSHGVWSMHADVSKMLEEIGVDITLISAGDHKVDGHPFGPLDPEAKAEIQRGVDLAFTEFTSALSVGRKVSKQQVLDTFGQGHMFEASRAKERKMIDGVATLNELLAGIIKPRESSRGRAKSLALDIAIAEEMGRG